MLSIALVVAITATTLGQAQAPGVGRAPADPMASTIERQLESEEPVTRAWGAYNAGAYQFRKAVPRLRALLEESTTTFPGAEQRAVVDVILESLIQLHVHLPARELEPFVEGWPVQTFLLLAGSSERDPVLAALLEKSSGFAWFAAANLLHERRDPALALHLVRTLRLRLTIVAVDGGFGSGSVGGIGCGIGADSLPSIQTGFPPRAQYWFVDRAVPGSIVVAHGPRPVYAMRLITSRPIPPNVNGDGPTNQERIAYIDAMLGHGSELAENTIRFVGWSNADAFSSQVSAIYGEVGQRYAAIMEELVRRFELPVTIAPPFPIELQVSDQRADRTAPLPPIR